MQARYYDANLGRFISMDSVSASAGDLYDFNRYAYANNNPLTFIDPTGQFSDVPTARKLDGVSVTANVPSWGFPGFMSSGSGVRGSSYGGGIPSGGSVRTESAVNVTANVSSESPAPIEVLPPIVFKLPQSRPIFRTLWYRPFLRKADDFLSDQLVKKLSNKTLSISKIGRPTLIPTPWTFFVGAMIYSPKLGGCDSNGHCADEWRPATTDPIKQ